jgi:hypothetical protein
MTQINEIKPVMLWLPINIFNTIIFVLFLVILYFVWKYFTKQKEVKKEKIKTNFWKVESIDDFKKDLENLEKNYLNSNKDIFYQKLSEILKNIFLYKTKKDISKLTLSEIKKIKLNQKLINLIENIYFKEYAKQIDDNAEIRKNLILEIKKLIK